MKYAPLIALTLALSLAACRNNDAPADSSPDIDLTVVPGTRVGAITAASTVEDIRQAYGADNVAEKSIYIGEGQSQAGLVVFPDSPREVEIVLNADTGRPEFVRISRDDTPWKTESGISVGTSVADLQRINGKPFSFYGFNWDFGGLVTDWQDGKLTTGLVIALAPADSDELPSDMQGESLVSSDDARLENFGIRVGSMVVTFPRD